MKIGLKCVRFDPGSMKQLISRQAYALFIRSVTHKSAELRVYAAPNGVLRFPVGTVNDREDLLEGLARELHEEMDIGDFKVLRKLGVHRYYKPDVDKHVERHDFLLQASDVLPDNFSYTVQSHDKDDGMIFDYHWMGQAEINQLDWEFKDCIKPEYIPVFFQTGEAGHR